MKANPDKCHFVVTTNALTSKYRLLPNNKQQLEKITRY